MDMNNFESVLEPEDTLLYAADERNLHGPLPTLTVTERWCAVLGSAVPHDDFQTHVRLNLLHQNQLHEEVVMLESAKQFGEQLRAKGHVRAMVNQAVKTQREWLSDPTSPKKAMPPLAPVLPQPAVPVQAQPAVPVLLVPVSPLLASEADRKSRAAVAGAAAGRISVGHRGKMDVQQVQQVLKTCAPARSPVSRKTALGFGVGAIQALDPSSAWLNALRGSFHLRARQTQQQKKPFKPPPTQGPLTETLAPEQEQVEQQDEDVQEDVQAGRQLQKLGSSSGRAPVIFDCILEGYEVKPCDSAAADLLAQHPSTPCSSKVTLWPQFLTEDPQAPVLWLCPSSPQNPSTPSPSSSSSRELCDSSSAASYAPAGSTRSQVSHDTPTKSQPWQHRQPDVEGVEAEGPTAPAYPSCFTTSGLQPDPPSQPGTTYDICLGNAAPVHSNDVRTSCQGWMHAARPPGVSAPATPSSTADRLLYPGGSIAAAVGTTPSPSSEADAAPTDSKSPYAPAAAAPSPRRTLTLPVAAPLSPTCFPAKPLKPAAPPSPTCFPPKAPLAPRPPHALWLRQLASHSEPELILVRTSAEQRPDGEDCIPARPLPLPVASPSKGQNQPMDRCRMSPTLPLKPLPLAEGQWQVHGVAIKSIQRVLSELPVALPSFDLPSFDRPRQRASISGGETEPSYWTDPHQLRIQSQSQWSPPDNVPLGWSPAAAAAAAAMPPPTLLLCPEEELVRKSPKFLPLIRGISDTAAQHLLHAASLPPRPRTAQQQPEAGLGAAMVPTSSMDAESAQKGGARLAAETPRKGGAGRLAPLSPTSAAVK